jgi:TetR/AcrR family transcriptional regulator, transcriptional repressor for nem operon
MATRRSRSAGTAERILDIAEQLVQVRGYNAFSYADVAGELGVTKASLHYHFAGKAELGEALISRYVERFGGALAAIDSEAADAAAKLRAYADLYSGVFRDGRMCLCGMLAADYETLPERAQESVIAFFDANEAWLERLLEEGRDDGTLHFEGRARDTARTIVTGLEGAMLVARPYGDLDRFEATVRTLLTRLTGAAG